MDTDDPECKPMRMVRGHKVRSIMMHMANFFQGDHDEKIILPTVKCEVEDATPGRGKIQRSSVFLTFGVIIRNISLTEKLLVTR